MIHLIVRIKTKNLPRKEYPIASIKCILAFLSQHSAPFINFGTKNKAANFSVSVSAFSRTLIHFLTGSAKNDLLSEADSEPVLEKAASDWSEAFAMVVNDVVILGVLVSLESSSSIIYWSVSLHWIFAGGILVSWKSSNDVLFHWELDQGLKNCWYSRNFASLSRFSWISHWVSIVGRMPQMTKIRINGKLFCFERWGLLYIWQ